MNITILISVLCILLGSILYMVSDSGKISELARITYAMGLLAFLLTFAGTVLKLTT